jgi:dolichol-phosphate mannosyltransferase
MPTSDVESIVVSARYPAAPPRSADCVVTLSAVVPLFDEQDNLPELHRRLSDTLSALGVEYELVLVNDGSTDRTRDLLQHLAALDPRVVPVHLSRNFGHQAAVTAGLDHARGQAVVVLDGDLQDPPELIPELVERWREGFDVAFAVRRKRKEGPAKRLGYFAFYRLLRAVADLDIPLDAGDFCLMDRRVVDALKRLPERGRFVRGLRTFVGFRQTGVSYERDARYAGVPKYTLRKLAGLALDGVVNFSTAPVRAVGGLAAILTLLGFGMLAWCGGAAACGAAPAGWLVTLAAVVFLSGLQTGCVGVVGLYVLKIFTEVKRRPSYIVDAKTPLSPRGEGGKNDRPPPARRRPDPAEPAQAGGEGGPPRAVRGAGDAGAAATLAVVAGDRPGPSAGDVYADAGRVARPQRGVPAAGVPGHRVEEVCEGRRNRLRHPDVPDRRRHRRERVRRPAVSPRAGAPGEGRAAGRRGPRAQRREDALLR